MKQKIYFKRLKEIASLTGILVALFFHSVMFGQAPTAGLKLYYSFETAPGGIVPDLSGNGYSGTLSPTATIDVADGKNVLVLGSSGTDFLDMGEATGALIASLSTGYSIVNSR